MKAVARSTALKRLRIMKLEKTKLCEELRCNTSITALALPPDALNGSESSCAALGDWLKSTDCQLQELWLDAGPRVHAEATGLYANGQRLVQIVNFVHHQSIARGVGQSTTLTRLNIVTYTYTYTSCACKTKTRVRVRESTHTQYK